jgi:signal transduction histidine kinase
VADLSQAILAGTPAAEVLELTGRHATSIVDATVAWVVGPLGRPGRLGVLAAFGEGADDLVGAEVSDGSFAARSMRDAQLITVPSLEERAVGTDAPLARGLGPTLFVALHHSDVVLGVLAVARPPGDQPFRLEEIRSVELFADQAALALHTSSMRTEIERLELLEERERIARDLHDTVIQRLFATGMTLQSSLGQVGPPGVRERLEQSITDLDDTIRSIRTTIFDLQRTESADTGSGARETLAAVVAESARSLGFEPSIRFVGPVDAAVGDDTLAEMVPTLREALSNVARHAAATAAVVTVSADDEVELSVTDDGRGMPGGRPAGGQGIDNMAARARRLGGRMRLEDAEPDGTRLVWRVPIGP